MLKTRARIAALAAEMEALRSAQADREQALQADMRAALAAVRTEVEGLRSTLAQAREQMEALQEARERDAVLLSELRDDLGSVRDAVADQSGARERLQMTVAKLELRMAQQAEELQTAAIALMARIDAVARDRSGADRIA